MNTKIIIRLVSGLFMFILVMFVITKMVFVLDAREIAVVQYPNGNLEAIFKPGPHIQGFGGITIYKKSFQYNFSDPKYTTKNNKNPNTSIKVRFNDGGHGQLSGSVRIDLPQDQKNMLNLHTRYGSQEAIENNLINNAISKAVYMSGPLMSSKESSNEKRNDLINYISDQAEHGVYKTSQREIKQIDPLSGEMKTVTVVIYQMDSTTKQYVRQEVSPLEQLHIGFTGLSVLGLDYDKTVDDQIAQQQKLNMEVQTSIATAKKAEQQAITIEKEGEATAAKAKWEQEALKATAVTEAEQELAVQQLAAQTALAYKAQQIAIGEGDAERKRLSTAANNNLDQKLAAYITVQGYWADAFSKYDGNIVPTYSTGNSSSNSNGALEFMQIMGMKAAKDLNLDLSTSK